MAAHHRSRRAQNLGSDPVTRSSFEFARPASPPRPRWGIRTVHRARHLFRETLSSNTGPHGSCPDGRVEPSPHRGGWQGNPLSQQSPGRGAVSPNPAAGREVFRGRPRVPCQTELTLKKTRWSSLVIGINAPFTQILSVAQERIAAYRGQHRAPLAKEGRFSINYTGLQGRGERGGRDRRP